MEKKDGPFRDGDPLDRDIRRKEPSAGNDPYGDPRDLDIRRKPPNVGDDPAMRLLLPVGTSVWAIAAGYLALFSVLCVPSPLALIAGIMAIREMRRDPTKHGMGRAVFGIVMGGIGTAFLLLMLVAFVAEALRDKK